MRVKARAVQVQGSEFRSPGLQSSQAEECLSAMPVPLQEWKAETRDPLKGRRSASLTSSVTNKRPCPKQSHPRVPSNLHTCATECTHLHACTHTHTPFKKLNILK